MQNALIPQQLQADFDQFLHYLEQLGEQKPRCCPHCASEAFSQTRAEPLSFRCKRCLKYFNPLTGTLFNRLQPIAWLPRILADRVNRKTHQEIADALDCDIKMIKRRDKAIKAQMQLTFSELYKWYHNHTDVSKPVITQPINDSILVQLAEFKRVIGGLLATTQSVCLYCGSMHTVKVGKRTTFHCYQCRRGFSLLHDTAILNLRRANVWFDFLDLLVAKNSNRAIASQLSMNHNTISSWRRRWCATMQLKGFEALALWCKRW